MTLQPDLFGHPEPAPARNAAFPGGWRYQPELITPADEARLLAQIRALPFRAFEFHGYTGRRRVVSFGWQYDFAGRQLRKAEPIPDFLRALRPLLGGFAGIDAEALQQALVSEYSPGAGIGWHRDKAVFEQTIGLSLLAPCVFRLRRPAGESWERVKAVVAPRSAYLLSGAVRTAWEHSIPPVDALRYSITFRSLRA